MIYYWVEDRDLIDSFFGTTMIVTMLGDDDKPETQAGLFLIGLITPYALFVHVLSWEFILSSIETQ
jgi:hypothetical protein